MKGAILNRSESARVNNASDVRALVCLAAAVSWLGPDYAAAADEPLPPSARAGFTAALTAGLNVTHPFGALQLGRRLESADFFEPYLAYSYNAAISKFPFHVLGVGTRTYFASISQVEVFHQAYVGAGLSGGGSADVPERDLGQRLLGAFLTQGLGAQLALSNGFHVALTCETGYPVWLRSGLTVQYLF